MIKFVYVEYGGKDIYFQELKYSLATLLDYHRLRPDEVIVYTENIERYRELPVTAVSIKNNIHDYSLGGRYHFRIKPCVVRRALIELGSGARVLFLDTDTYVKRSLYEHARRINSGCVLMNAREKSDPYPENELRGLSLPSGPVYCYDHSNSLMFNSGVIGVEHAHISQLTDAIHIIDGMLDAGFTAHTIEQCAVTEAFRVSGVEILEVNKEVNHYWRGIDKKYMHKKIGRLKASPHSLPQERIAHSWIRARCEKYFGSE